MNDTLRGGVFGCYHYGFYQIFLLLICILICSFRFRFHPYKIVLVHPRCRVVGGDRVGSLPHVFRNMIRSNPAQRFPEAILHRFR